MKIVSNGVSIEVKGVGVPAGGTDGQILAKDGEENYKTKWIDPPSGGGTDFATDDTLTLNEDDVLGVSIPVHDVINQEDFDVLPLEKKNHGLYVIRDPSSNTKLAINGEVIEMGGGGASDRLASTPTQSGVMTYTGQAQSPQWNFNPLAVAITGTLSGVDAGDYPVEFTLKEGWCWDDYGTNEPRQGTWTISKAPGQFSLSTDNLSLDLSNYVKTFTVNQPGDGKVVAVSGDLHVADTSVSGNTVTVTAKGRGSTVITVHIEEGTNHFASEPQTVEIVCDNMPSAILNENDWATIRATSDAGLAPLFWNVGDYHEVTLNGTVGKTKFTEFSCYAYIIGFDHNSKYEYTKRIHFMFGKVEYKGEMVDIAFTDDKYFQAGGTGSFCANTTATSKGGWAGSYIRNTTCKEFLNALPQDLRSVIKSVTKYTDNEGDGTENTKGNVRSTSETIFLPAEFEITGNSIRANDYEESYQAQYEYFSYGVNYIKKKSSLNMDTIVGIWTRSPYYRTAGEWVATDMTAATVSRSADWSMGFCPAFCV